MPLTYKEHLVACLAEEAGEVTQMASKVLRFYDVETGQVLVGNDRVDGKQGNALELLQNELGDLLGVIAELIETEVLSDPIDFDKLTAKREKIKLYWKKVENARQAKNL